MWKKDEVTDPAARQPDSPRSNPRPTPEPSDRTGKKGATIGPSITVQGDVSGNEDLLIEGRVEGSVNLKDQSVTVGQEGRVKADIDGRVVTVEGEVEGDLHAIEQVILRSTAQVQGDITAPRVVLEDGATFRGLVDMGSPAGGERKARQSPPAGTTGAKTESETADKTKKEGPSAGSAE